jgi:hypothetical protein
MTAQKKKPPMSREERVRRIKEGKERARLEREAAAAAAEASTEATLEASADPTDPDEPVSGAVAADAIAGRVSHDHGAGTHAHEWGDADHTHVSGLAGPPQFAPQAEVVTPDRAGLEHLASELEETPEEKARKDREHAIAMEEAHKADSEANVQFPIIARDPDAEIVLHVVNDGFTALGKVWYYGEEIRLRVGTDAYKLACDRNGRPFFDMDEAEQIKRYGKVQFKTGAWEGRGASEMSEDAYMKALSEGDHDAVKRYEKQQQRKSQPKVPSSR